MSQRFASIWDAIEETPALAENMKLRSSLMLTLKKHIAQEGMTQAKAATKFGVTQPRISDLLRGKIDLFAIDTLVNMLATAGIPVELRVGKAASAAKKPLGVEGDKLRRKQLSPRSCALGGRSAQLHLILQEHGRK